MNLRDIVQTYRKKNNLSQQQFAAICGLSNGCISMIERNINPSTGIPVKPSIETLQKLATGMGDFLARTTSIKGQWSQIRKHLCSILRYDQLLDQ